MFYIFSVKLKVLVKNAK